ncbi:MATE family efflux transporter [Globicatella sanguinis]
MLAKLIEPKNFTIEEQQKIFTNEQLKMLIIPILIEQFLMLVVGLVDTLMVSYSGEAAVSGVALVYQINAVFLSVFAALAAGGAVVISQYIGRQEKKECSIVCKSVNHVVISDIDWCGHHNFSF